MIELVNITEVKENPNNPRTINDDKFKKLVKSIKEFPQMLKIRPIVVDDNMIVLGGNMRLKACKEAGITEVHIIKADELTEEQKKEFTIKDNVGFGEWDWQDLKDNWDQDELVEWGMDLPEFFEEEEEETTGDDDAPEVPEDPETVLGDLWELGDHRLLCGDSTSMDDVDKLTNKIPIDIIFTDPPYNVSFNGRSGKHDIIMNDNLSDSDFSNFIDGTINTIIAVNAKAYYVWCNWKFYGILQDKLEYKSCIVWAKNVFGMGNGYRHQHEFCLYNGKIDDHVKNESDLWEIKKDTNYVHPTQKPVALSVRAFSNHVKYINVLDLFGGSGSTLIGAEQTRRKAHLMELDPKYCDVIVKRYINFCRENNRPFTVKLNGEEYKGELLNG